MIIGGLGGLCTAFIVTSGDISDPGMTPFVTLSAVTLITAIVGIVGGITLIRQQIVDGHDLDHHLRSESCLRSKKLFHTSHGRLQVSPLLLLFGLLLMWP